MIFRITSMVGSTGAWRKLCRKTSELRSCRLFRKGNSMDWQILAAFLTATLLLLVTPGPVVAIVAHNTFRGGAMAGIVTALGIEIGEALVLAAVFSGLILSQEFLPLLFRWISFAGIA